MRQQFLAHEMEKAHEMDADIVSVLHIAPAVNHDFHRITSPGLIGLGNSAVDVWKKLLKEDHDFLSISTEDLFGSLMADQLPEVADWIEFIYSRYLWLSK